MGSLAGHTRILLDTAPLIYLLEGDGRAPGVEGIIDAGSAGVSLLISVVTEMELLVGPLRSGDREQASVVREFLDQHVTVLDMTREIARSAAEVRATKTLSLPDAVVIATALESGCTLIVGNDARFRRLEGIEYLHLDDHLPDDHA